MKSYVSPGEIDAVARAIAKWVGHDDIEGDEQLWMDAAQAAVVASREAMMRDGVRLILPPPTEIVNPPDCGCQWIRSGPDAYVLTFRGGECGRKHIDPNNIERETIG